MVRRPEIILSPTVFSTFWVLGVLGAQKGPKMGSERPSADRFQAVSDTIARDRRLFPYGHFSPTDRSTCTPRRGKQTTRSQSTSCVDTSVPFNGLPDLLGEKERCDRNHHGIWWIDDNAVQEALNAVLAA